MTRPVRVLTFNGASEGDIQPYGAQAMSGLGYSLDLPRTFAVPAKVQDVMNHRFGVRVDRPGLLRARRADLVLAYLEPNIGFPALMRRAVGSPLRHVPLVGIFCWAAEDLLSAPEGQRRRVSRMLAACDLVGYFSSNQTDVLQEGGARPEALALLPFGVDTHYFAAAEVEAPRDIDVISIGWDRGRDYATLATAMRGTGISTKVVAPSDRFDDVDVPPELDVVGTVPRETYRELLSRSRVCVVPTHELAYPTGQSVALEAAAAGCAVVVTGTRAMSDYFTAGVTAEMPSPGDAAGLRDAVIGLLEDDPRRTRLALAGREHVLGRFDESHLWQAVDAQIRSRGWTDEAARSKV